MIGAAILGVAGLRLTAWERDFLRDYNPLGAILFARNVDNPDQVASLTAELREVMGRDIPILIDQEGGRVQRLRAPHWHEWEPPLDTVLRAGENAPRAMWLRARLIAADLADLGLDANCAPVADIAGPDTHPFLRNRCYGQTAQTVTQIARAVADAHLDAGILPVIKHIPGHGRSVSDTHHDLPHVTATLADLMDQDFAPFRALNDLPMAMTAHIVFDALDPTNPATQSADVIAVIRNQIGFDGLLLSDDLNMNALAGDLTQRTARALAAGCDIALQCNGNPVDMQTVAAAAPSLTRPDRVDRALSRRHASPPIDRPALMAEFSAIMGGAM